MKTVVHRAIDGHQVVIHIEPAVRDPVATQNAVEALVTALPEWAELQGVLARVSEIRQGAYQAFVSVFRHSPDELISQAERDYWDVKSRAAEIEVSALSASEAPIRKALAEKVTEFWNTHAKYCNPGEGADLMPDDKADPLEEKLRSITELQALTLSGEIVPDLRGLSVWSNVTGVWAKRTIGKLGESPEDGEKLESDLSDGARAEIAQQIEAERITALSDADRAQEVALIQPRLLAEAQSLADRAKITGEAFDAKAWYDAEVAGLRDRYGLSAEVHAVSV